MKKIVMLFVCLGAASTLWARSLSSNRRTPPPKPASSAPVSTPAYSSLRSAPTDLFSAYAGPTIPLGGDLSDVADPGVVFGGQWVHLAQPDLGFGIDTSFSFYGTGTVNRIDNDVRQFSVHGVVRRSLATEGTQPYLLGGFGATSTSIRSSSDGGWATQSDTSPSFLLGAGIDLPLSNGLSAGAGLRYTQYFFKIGNDSGGGSLQLLAHLSW